VIAGGHGAFEPKKLPGYEHVALGGRGAHYLVSEKAEFAGKRVIVVGGGDSACDWTLNLLDTASEITLVHRREAFRAHEVTVKEIEQAAQAGKVDVRTPYQIRTSPATARSRPSRSSTPRTSPTWSRSPATPSCSSSASRPRSAAEGLALESRRARSRSIP